MGHQVITLLDELAWLAAETDDGARLPALQAVVVDLEELAGAPLGGVAGEPAAVLHRRVARAHRLLLREERAGIAERLELLVGRLQPHRSHAAASATDTAARSSAAAVAHPRAEWNAATSRTS